MTNTLTAAALAAMFSTDANDAVLRLVELTHASWSPSTRRFVHDVQDLTGGGGSQLYTQFNFRIEPPNDLADITRVKLILDNIDRELMAEVRSVIALAPISVVLKLVLASAPNTLIMPAWTMQATQMQYNLQRIELTCLFQTNLSEQVPQHVQNPARNPGLYKESE
jgi:hypothetical protein